MRKLITVALFLLVSACSVDYVVRQGMGQLSIVVNRVSVDDVLNHPDTLEPHRDQIRFILKVKEFAEAELGLTKSGNYTTYYDTLGRPVSYTVSACRKDRFEPYVWDFLVVGSVPYKGYFDPEEAKAEYRRLNQKGYDTALHGVAAYSTLGWFSDPIFSTMLSLPKPQLANLIIHELVHGTIYAKGHADFNESVASFIAEEGTFMFLEKVFGSESDEYAEAWDWVNDGMLYAGFMQELHKQLDRLYRMDLPEEEKIRRRQWIFLAAHEEFEKTAAHMRTPYFAYTERHMNNAEVLANLRYHRRELYEPVYDALGQDLQKFIEHAKRAAGQPDPSEAVRHLR